MTEDEKLAEEYANTVKCEWENDTYYVDCRDEIEEAFLAGLKAGRETKWHDLKKDPSVTEQLEELEKANEWHYVKDELPPKKVPLNIITFDKNKKRRVWVGEYNGGNGQWWTGYFNHFIDVPYAWKEIVLPKRE